MGVTKESRKKHPRETAGVLSLLFYGYVLKIYYKAFKKDFTENDMYRLPPAFEIKKCGGELEQTIKLNKTTFKNTSILSYLGYKFGAGYFISAVPYILIKFVRSIYEPELISNYISYFKEGQTELTMYDALYYSSALFGIMWLYSFIMGQYYILIVDMGLKIRTSVVSLIYKKSLKLSHITLKEMGVGYIVTLMTKDVSILENTVKWSLDLFVSIIQIITTISMLYFKMGPISLIGIVFLFISILLKIMVGKFIRTIRVKIDNVASERIKVTKEALASLKVIKMLCWQNFFFNKIVKLRQVEVIYMIKDAYLKSMITVMGILSPDITIFILVMSCIWLGYPLNTELLFYIINCVRSIRVLITFILPRSIGMTADMLGCIKRINRLLHAQELPTRHDQFSDNPKVLLKNVNVQVDNKLLLSRVSLIIRPGLTTIIGPSGSGKSTLLLTILREYSHTGNIVTNGRISYASQSPWLFPATIKDNILFEEEYDCKRYNEVIRICRLQDDFDCFEDGDESVVVNGGFNLSKGQQSRIGLARALYKDSEIYLLDDCLSVLDMATESRIREGLKTFFQDRIGLIVTQSSDFVSYSDNVVVLEEGRVKYFGHSSNIEPSDLNFVQKPKSNKDDLEKLDVPTETLSETPDENDSLLEKKQLYVEEQKVGFVPLRVYIRYLKFGRGYFMFIFILSLFIVSQFANTFSTKTLTKWIDLEHKKLLYVGNSTKYSEAAVTSMSTIQLYVGLILTSIILTLLKIYMYYDFTKLASIKINKELTLKIFNSTLTFIDTHLLGSILNRFSQDMNNMDEHLPLVVLELTMISFSLCGIVIIICIVHWKLLIPTAALFAVLLFLRNAFMPAGRSLKRLETSIRSPFIGHINATLEGLGTIRAHGVQKQQNETFEQYYDAYNSVWFTLLMCSYGHMFFMDVVCHVFVMGMIWGFLFVLTGISAGSVGLAIVQLFSIRNNVAITLRSFTEMEILMTSLERILEYTEQEQEDTKGLVIEDWPKNGAIKFNNVTLSYAHSQQVLKNVNFEIKPGEKVGIIGRTGSGKSSLVSLLLKLYDYQGTILIDNVDIKTVSMEYLRKRIDFIPQDPVLFSDNLRSNIDPLNEHSDDEIWTVISKLKIKRLIPNLYDSADSYSFSCGEKHLICLARAMIRKNKILIMDEPTAHLDLDTEQFLMNVINEHFSTYTIINISHKMHCFKGYDRVFKIENKMLSECEIK